MKSNIVIALCLLGIAVTALVEVQHINRLSAKADKLQQFCIGARDAMRQDAMAFESGDPAQREAAYQRFYEGHALYHSAESLLYCVDTLPEMPLGCQLNKDWACLAKIARQIAATLAAKDAP